MNIYLAHKATRLLMVEAFEHQTLIVDELLSNGTFAYKDIKNYFREYVGRGACGSITALSPNQKNKNAENDKQIVSWVPVRDLLSHALMEYGAPILKNEHGSWWGRTSINTTIFRDPTILGVTENIYRKVGGLNDKF